MASDDKLEGIMVSDGVTFTQPVRAIWNPKEDITVYELARILPWFLRISPIMPADITDESFWRHFDIEDPNKYAGDK